MWIGSSFSAIAAMDALRLLFPSSCDLVQGCPRVSSILQFRFHGYQIPSAWPLRIRDLCSKVWVSTYRWRVLRDMIWYVTDHGWIKRVVALSLLGVAGLEIIVSSNLQAVKHCLNNDQPMSKFFPFQVMSFFHRELLSLGFIAMGVWLIVCRKSLQEQVRDY